MRIPWLIPLILLLIILFFGLSGTIVYENGAIFYLQFILIFGLIPFSFYKAFPGSEYSDWFFGYRLIITLLLPIGLGIGFGEWGDSLEKRRLKREGIITKGIITKAWRSTGKYGKNLLTAHFVNGTDTIETSSYRNTKGFQTGDSVTIIFASSYPRINRIIELEE